LKAEAAVKADADTYFLQTELTTVKAELEALKETSTAELKEAASEIESLRMRSCELQLELGGLQAELEAAEASMQTAVTQGEGLQEERLQLSTEVEQLRSEQREASVAQSKLQLALQEHAESALKADAAAKAELLLREELENAAAECGEMCALEVMNTSAACKMLKAEHAQQAAEYRAVLDELAEDKLDADEQMYEIEQGGLSVVISTESID
jgi:chromosome segregation ATPase